MNSVTNYIMLLIVAGVIALGVACNALSKKLEAANVEIERQSNNNLYYQGRLANEVDTNNAFRATLSDLNNSNDSLVQIANKVAKNQRVKPTALSHASVITQVIVDTIQVTLTDTISIDFDATVTHNEQTVIHVSRRNDKLTVVPAISNTVTVLTYTEDKYIHKTFLSRLLRLNFKKTRQYKYAIENSNSAIKNTDAIVIDMVK
jgi:hypothetical protein